MIIRQAQIDTFQRAAIVNFEEEMFKHLRSFAPQHTASMGAPVLRTLIHAGIDQAKLRGLTNRGPVRLYLESMLRLGSGFDSDPQFPWAIETLSDPAAIDQMIRADRLFAAITEYIDNVIGPNYEFEKQAIDRFNTLSVDDLNRSVTNAEEAFIRYTSHLYPEKYHYVGDAALRNLYAEARGLAIQYSMASGAGDLVLSGLMFAFGHCCILDSQFPWILEVIAERSVTSSEEKVAQLFHRMQAYLRAGRASLGAA